MLHHSLQEPFLLELFPGNSARLGSDVDLWARFAPCRVVVSVGVHSLAHDRTNAGGMDRRHRILVIKVYQGHLQRSSGVVA